MNYDGYDMPSTWEFVRGLAALLAMTLAVLTVPALIVGAFYIGLHS